MTQQRVVVGIDGSPGSAAAVRWVAQHARLSDVAVTAVYVLEPVVVPLDFTGAALTAVPRLDPQRLHERALAVLRAMIADNAPELVGRIDTRVVAGTNPAQSLLGAAADASMLVVGAHHHHGLGLLLGSTGAGCVRHASCPVVVVPADWRAPALPAAVLEEVRA